MYINLYTDVTTQLSFSHALVVLRSKPITAKIECRFFTITPVVFASRARSLDAVGLQSAAMLIVAA